MYTMKYPIKLIRTAVLIQSLKSGTISDSKRTIFNSRLVWGISESIKTYPLILISFFSSWIGVHFYNPDSAELSWAYCGRMILNRYNVYNFSVRLLFLYIDIGPPHALFTCSCSRL